MRFLFVFLIALITFGCSSTPSPTATLESETSSATNDAITPAAPTATPRSSTPTAAPSPTVQQPTTTTVPATSTVAPATPTTAGPPVANGTPSDRATAQVVKVVDGDTVDVSIDGRTERLRLIGIDTPETVDPREPVQCFGREASAKAHELLDGQMVQLEADESQGERDNFDRLLRYVWLPDGQLYNKLMIAEGYAHEYTYDEAYRYQAEFKAAYREAQVEGRGLWSPTTCNGDTEQPADSEPTAAPKPQAQPTATTAPSTVSRGVPPISKDDCPASHPIKGNQGSRSTTDWIYHAPGSRSYNATDPEECFVTEADAKSAGYRAPQN